MPPRITSASMQQASGYYPLQMTYQQQLTQLDQCLQATRQWWQFGAFHSLQSRWRELEPELDRRLNRARLGYADFQPQALPALEDYLVEAIPQLQDIKALTELPVKNQHRAPPNPHWQQQIAGRKWQQISHFAAHVPSQKHLLDWCSGKGHLGRLAASGGAKSLTSFEWQENLCQKNRLLNQRLQIAETYCDAQVLQQDVLSDGPMTAFQSNHFCLALHACGDLHTHLIRRLVDTQAEGLCLAPCCYNLIKASHYQALSVPGRQSGLKLSKLDLSLPLRQTVTAGARERREQQQERRWRIAFDCWQRQVLGVDAYLPLPTIPKRILKSDFKTFLQWAAEQKASSPLIQAVSTVDEKALFSQTEERLPAIAQMEWVQSHFQRAIELWLVLDQVVFLQDSGYDCELFEFCQSHLTPRNLLVKASRQ